jgi:hypothetical protein
MAATGDARARTLAEWHLRLTNGFAVFLVCWILGSLRYFAYLFSETGVQVPPPFTLVLISSVAALLHIGFAAMQIVSATFAVVILRRPR